VKGAADLFVRGAARHQDEDLDLAIGQAREAFKQLVGALRGAFQEMTMTVDGQYADGDVVVTEWTSRAVHRGSLNGLPPTGRAGTTTGITVSRFAGDKISQDHAIWDLFGLLQRLGAIPS
jgi:predicted ester cyclase